MLDLSEDQIASALPKIEKPLEKYIWLQERFSELRNPEADEEFCRRFSGFYRVRARNTSWREAYFTLMGTERENSLDFKSCLTKLQTATGRVEASFTSKLLATLDPMLPVLDSVVLGHLGLRLPPWSTADRIEKATEVYDQLAARMNDYVRSTAGQTIVAAFRQHSAAFNCAAVTNIKIIDLVLWQVR